MSSLVGGRQHGPAGREHLAGDALAEREPVAEPLRPGQLWPGGRVAVAVRVEQVDARHVAADGEVGLARERVEHRLQLERHVERVGGAGQRAVALGLRRRGAARTPAAPGPAPPGWRASRRSGSRPVFQTCALRRASTATWRTSPAHAIGTSSARGPRSRVGQRRAELGHRPGLVEHSERAVATTCATPGAGVGSPGRSTSTPSTCSAPRASAENAATSSGSEHADSAASERRRSGACARARVVDAGVRCDDRLRPRSVLISARRGRP